jgi:hypothetical protein
LLTKDYDATDCGEHVMGLSGFHCKPALAAEVDAVPNARLLLRDKCGFLDDHSESK